MSTDDIYADLRPPTPVGADEICQCPGSPPVKLMAALCYNPVHCTQCNLGVPPDRIPLTVDLVRDIAYWRWIYDAIYRLWLDSEDYEEWAERELGDIRSRVNQLGHRIVPQLSRIRKAYYWLFQNESLDEFQPRTACPLCGRDLTEFRGGFFVQKACEPCQILLSAKRPPDATP